MKTSFFLSLTIALSLSCPAGADPGDRHFLFKAAALLPVQIEKVDSKGETVITKISLGSKELVNLALGRPVFQTLDKETEVLVVDVNHDDENASELIVFNPKDGFIWTTIIKLAAGGAPSVKGGTHSHTDKSKGTGLSPGSILATDPGLSGLIPGFDLAKNSLADTDICAAANGSWTPTDSGPTFSLAATGIIGDFKGKMTDKKAVTTSIDGVVIKGTFTASGKSIFRYTEGTTFAVKAK